MIEKIFDIIDEGFSLEAPWDDLKKKCDKIIYSLNAKQVDILREQIESHVRSIDSIASEEKARIDELLNYVLVHLWLKKGVELGSDIFENKNGGWWNK